MRGGSPAMRARVSHTAHVDLPAPLRNARTQMPKIPDWARGRRGFGRRDARTARSCVPPAPARRAPRAAPPPVRGAARGGATSRRRARRTPRPDRFGQRDARTVRACAPLDHSTRFGFDSRRVAWPCGWSRGGKTVRGGGVGRVGGLEVNKRALERASSTCARSCGRVGRLEVNKRARRASLVHLRDILPLS